ncbi:hypothetical protein HanXRQr2_Chr08g0339691 [Helianthus annuus]|uniref:Uncharacterized protein n=1 Tax=Helianthus annuus TaxID=4232 RepID=A0A9K3IEN3_HELAN|nr:hypothetical protein HanXRQr2_Chr08g0339691 [Helianthus annuus]
MSPKSVFYLLPKIEMLQVIIWLPFLMIITMMFYYEGPSQKLMKLPPKATKVSVYIFF